jgi:hypothetical protein
MNFDFWHLLASLALHCFPEILTDVQQPGECFGVAFLRAMAKHIGGDGLDAFDSAPSGFESQAAVANATAAGCCALAGQRMLLSTGRRLLVGGKLF